MPETLALMLLFADVVQEITPGIPWVGTGLVGAVLWWVLYTHVPRLVEQNATLAGLVQTLVERSDAREDKVRDEFLKALTGVMESQKVANAELVRAIQGDLQRVLDRLTPPGSALHTPLPQGNHP